MRSEALKRAQKKYYEKNKDELIAVAKAYYRNNKEVLAPKKREQKRKYRQNIRNYIREAKDIPCTDCGTCYPYYVMQFDHLPEYEKEFNLSDISGKSLKMVKEEIAKCEVVCANCHAVRTYTRIN